MWPAGHTRAVSMIRGAKLTGERARTSTRIRTLRTQRRLATLHDRYRFPVGNLTKLAIKTRGNGRYWSAVENGLAALCGKPLHACHNCGPTFARKRFWVAQASNIL